MAVISNCAILLVLTAAVLMVPSSGKNRQSLTAVRYPGTPEVDIDDLKFLLYTKKNQHDPIEIKPHEQEQAGKGPLYLNPSHNFKIITHGFMGSAKDGWIIKAKDRYLKKKNYNIVVVDWSQHAAYDYTYWFNKAKKSTHQVGEHLANLLIGMIKKYDFDAKQLHLIGHQLGAYVMGAAGRRFRKKTEDRIGRITATAPAGPCFEYHPSDEVPLSKRDAMFVDVIHTDGGMFGHYPAIGHVDFYPNGGLRYPGCRSYRVIDWLTDIPCSSNRAHDLFVESINSKKFRSRKCTSYEAYKKKKCMGKTATMGEHLEHKRRGVYYLQTNWKAPFAMNDDIREDDNKYKKQKRGR